MAVPKRKTSKSKRNMRNSNKGLSQTVVAFDKEGRQHRPHYATYVESEGAYYYKGRKVLQMKNIKESK